jgi:hypothetical protein
MGLGQTKEILQPTTKPRGKRSLGSWHLLEEHPGHDVDPKLDQGRWFWNSIQFTFFDG